MKNSLFDGVVQRDRRSLARALSLVESTSADDRAAAAELMHALRDYALQNENKTDLDRPTRRQSRRIGITGSPGVGKSTFIEAWGMRLVEAGHRVAVLAVDPSSKRSGGSILGDKVRMSKLSVHPNAYVRPSPSRLALGGTTTSMRESIFICEAAGFDTVLVETVGVGQSESDVADMVDLFTLLVLPNAGDEMQGIKRGIMELADVVLVTKSDVDPKATQRSVSQIQSALRLMLPSQPAWSTPALPVSSTTGDGLEAFEDVVDRFFADGRSQHIEQRRAQQDTHSTAARMRGAQT